MWTKTDEQKKGLRIIFVVSVTTDKQKKNPYNNLYYAEALSIILLNCQAGPKFVITNIENVHIQVIKLSRKLSIKTK